MRISLKVKGISNLILMFVMLFSTETTISYAQAKPQNLVIKVTPNHKDGVYTVGEKAFFAVSVTLNNSPLKDVEINYEIGPEKMDATIREKRNLKEGNITIEGGTMLEPGFLRCVVTLNYEGKPYRALATVGFDPLKIKTTTILPSDFMAFWDNEKAKAAKIPLDPKLELLSDRSTETVNVYQVSFQNHQLGSRIYGILSVPKKEGKYPAVVRFPGAGVRAHNGNQALPAKGIITLEIGIHGIPVNMTSDVYNNLYRGALSGYPYFNLDSRNSYYFKRVYLGCIKALDFVYTLPQFDGENLAVAGSSQGGALSIVTTALDARVKYILAFCPAMSDLTGFLHGRAAGWPNMFNNSNKNLNATKDKIVTSGYYDVVNFARFIKVPGIYSWGFNDETTPPTSTYSAYNVITAPKELFIVPEIGHQISKEQTQKWFSWLESKLLSK